MPWFCSKVTDVMMMGMAGLTDAVHGQPLGLTTMFAHSCSSPAAMECVFLHSVLEAKLTSSILQEEPPLQVTLDSSNIDCHMFRQESFGGFQIIGAIQICDVCQLTMT